MVVIPPFVVCITRLIFKFLMIRVQSTHGADSLSLCFSSVRAMYIFVFLNIRWIFRDFYRM